MNITVITLRFNYSKLTPVLKRLKEETLLTSTLKVFQSPRADGKQEGLKALNRSPE